MKLPWLILAAVGAWAQAPDVAQIMSRVAENQARSLQLRRFYVYNQKQLLKMVRGSGKVAREEHREYFIMPQDSGIKKDLTRFDGKYERHGKFIAYDHPGYTYKEMDIDGEIIDDMSKDLTDDKGSRDGLCAGLFPLTEKEQKKYQFKFVGAEDYRGRPVYRVHFEPRQRTSVMDLDDGDAAWKGDALIDTAEYQPVLVTTKLAVNIPRAVKILLGTNIRGLGFSVTYRKFEDGLWFPVSYGGEFDLRAVFFYKRMISVSMVNSDFKRADVTSSVAYKIEEQ